MRTPSCSAMWTTGSWSQLPDGFRPRRPRQPTILCDEHFYGGDIILETEAALDFLGFRLDLECGTISFIPSYEKHNMLSIKSAAPMMHKESGYYSRRTLISRVSFPEFQRDHDLTLLKKLYHQHGFTLQKKKRTGLPLPLLEIAPTFSTLCPPEDSYLTCFHTAAV